MAAGEIPPNFQAKQGIMESAVSRSIKIVRKSAPKFPNIFFAKLLTMSKMSGNFAKNFSRLCDLKASFHRRRRKIFKAPTVRICWLFADFPPF